MAVTLFHYARFIPGEPLWLRHAIESGNEGVPFFFTLSGFILVYVSQRKDLSDPLERRQFWIRRIARIYPVYAFAWALFGLALVGEAWLHIDRMTMGYAGKDTALFGALSLSLIQAWVPGAPQMWNWPGWSLSAEAFFYALFPLLFMRLRSQRTGLLWLAFAGAAVFNAGYVGLNTVSDGHRILIHSLFTDDAGNFVSALPILNLPAFVLGLILGIAYCRGLRLKHARLWTFASVGVLLGLFACGPEASILWLPRNAFIAPVCCALILSLGSLSPSNGRSIGMLLGKASYALYILQFPLWGLFLDLLRPSVETQRSWGYVGAFALVLTILSVLVYQFLERPAEKWIRSRYLSKPNVLATSNPRSTVEAA